MTIILIINNMNMAVAVIKVNFRLLQLIKKLRAMANNNNKEIKIKLNAKELKHHMNNEL